MAVAAVGELNPGIRLRYAAPQDAVIAHIGLQVEPDLGFPQDVGNCLIMKPLKNAAFVLSQRRRASGSACK